MVFYSLPVLTKIKLLNLQIFKAKNTFLKAKILTYLDALSFMILL